MSSLFKFGSKQSKEFIDLACKAIINIKKDEAKVIYKSIKHGNNSQWSSLDDATDALKQKFKLNIQIVSYQKIINDKENNTLREVQSAKSHLVKLTRNEQTSKLISDIEKGFNLEKGSLIPKVVFNAHIIPSSRSRRGVDRKRSLSVTNNNGIPIYQQ